MGIKNAPPVKAGDYQTKNGKTVHVLEVQDGAINVKELLTRLDKKAKEIKHGQISR